MKRVALMAVAVAVACSGVAVAPKTPLPSWPQALEPQHQTLRAVLSAQVWKPPAEISW